MSARPIDSLVAAQERLQQAIASYVAVAEQVIALIDEIAEHAESDEELEAEA